MQKYFAEVLSMIYLNTFSQRRSIEPHKSVSIWLAIVTVI